MRTREVIESELKLFAGKNRDDFRDLMQLDIVELLLDLRDVLEHETRVMNNLLSSIEYEARHK